MDSKGERQQNDYNSTAEKLSLDLSPEITNRGETPKIKIPTAQEREDYQCALDIVKPIARKLATKIGYQHELNMFISVGVEACFRAIQDKRAIGKTVNYRYLEIRANGAIMDYLRNIDHISRRQRDKIKKLLEKGKKVELKHPLGIRIELEEIQDNHTNPEETSIDDILDKHYLFEKALEKLKLDKIAFKVFHMFHVENKTNGEIAAELKLSPTRINQILSRAQKKLMQVIEKRGK